VSHPVGLLAALVFREEIHSSAPMAYIVLTLALNFVLFTGLGYAVLSWISPSPMRFAAPHNGPVKGVLYPKPV